MTMSSKIRVDQRLVELGLSESRSQAQRLVMAGQVRAAGQVVSKPSTRIDPAVLLTVDRGPRFVSRGGGKLAAAFEAFDLKVAGQVCADVGASTGGFTDCLLQHDAAKVYTIDVGRGILHWKLRNHPHVVVMEGVNARYLDTLPEPVSFITIDASFISLNILLPVVLGWLDVNGQVIALIKPQFEAGRKEVARGKGVIRDPHVHHQVLLDLLSGPGVEGYAILGLHRSPVLGPKGNLEFLAWLTSTLPAAAPPPIPLDERIAQVLEQPEAPG